MKPVVVTRGRPNPTGTSVGRRLIKRVLATSFSEITGLWKVLTDRIEPSAELARSGGELSPVAGGFGRGGSIPDTCKCHGEERPTRPRQAA